jgi:hypothetical protein
VELLFADTAGWVFWEREEGGMGGFGGFSYNLLDIKLILYMKLILNT